MHEQFCLNTATINTTPLDLQIELAREAGFRRIGLWSKDVEAALAHGKSLGDIKAHLNTAGLQVAELCFLGGWQDADEERLKEVLKRTARLCELARGLGCEIVVTVPSLRPGWRQGAPGRFQQVCRVAGEYGVRIALEFPCVASDVKDLRSAWELVSAAACSNGGLVIDTFHFFLGESKLADLEDVAREQLFLVHISDALNLPREELQKPHDNRTFPGDGIIDFGPMLEQLGRLEYAGAISLEVWNSKHQRSDPAEIVRKGYTSLQRVANGLNHNGRK